MFDSSELRDELQTPKADVSRLLNATSDGILDTSRNRAEALADQIKAALNDLGEPSASTKTMSRNSYRTVRSRRSPPHSRWASSSASR